MTRPGAYWWCVVLMLAAAQVLASDREGGIMAINAEQLLTEIIRPTLKDIGHHSRAAEILLMGTAAHESHLGTFVRQRNQGPAVGIFQMEPATHDDIWANYLEYQQDKADAVRQLCNRCDAQEMIGNLYYAAAMARMHYLRVPTLLPQPNDLDGMAAYWKRHYNTYKGKGTTERFKHDYHHFVGDAGGEL